MEQHYSIPVSTKNKLELIFLALMGVILVFLPTSHYGAGVTPDSVKYIGTARNLLNGAGVVSFSGDPLIAQPPLFPTLLALAAIPFKTDPLVVVNYVNALIYGFIVYFGGLLIFKHLSSFPGYALVGSLVILASNPLFTVAVMAWSEPLFILLVILSLILVDLYLEKGDLIYLLLLALSVALSTLTRYIGIVLIAWAIFTIIINYRIHLTKIIGRLALFTIISILPLGIWLSRNYAVSNSLVGPRYPSGYSLSQNIMFMFNNFLNWYIPVEITDNIRILISVMLLISLLVGLYLNINRQNIKAGLQRIQPVALFIIFYTVFLVISSTTTAYDQIGNRLLSPIYVPLTLLILVLTKILVEAYLGSFSKKVINSFLLFTLATWLLVQPIRYTIMNAVNLTSIGRGYSGEVWTKSETVQYLLRHQTLENECTLYTNGSDVAYFLTNLETQYSPDRKDASPGSVQQHKETFELTGHWPEEDKACLIWFDKIVRPNLLTVDELREIANINLITDLEDGAIYSITGK